MEVSRRLMASWVPVALITVLGAGLRFTFLPHSYWVDEVVTSDLVEGPFVAMLRAIPHAESTPPLYYVLAWIWSRVAGADEASMRSLSALFGTLTIPICYASTRTLVSHRAGVIVAALAAVNPLLVWYSQEARAYGLYILLGALSFLCFSLALRNPSPRRLTLWAGTSSLLLLTHYFGVFLAGAEAALLLYRHRRLRVWTAAGAVAGIGVALVPLAAYQTTHASSSWIRHVDLSGRIQETLQQLLAPVAPSMWAGAGVAEVQGREWWPLGIVILAAAVATIVALGSRRERHGALVALGVGLATVVAPVLLSLTAALVTGGRGDVFLFRNVVVAWLPLAVVVGTALGAQRAGRTGVLTAVALATMSFAVVVHNQTTPERQRDDWRLVAQALGNHSGQVVLLSPSWQIAALQHYVPDVRELDDRAAATREIDVLVRRNVPGYSPAIESLSPPTGFTKVGTRVLKNWLLTRYSSPRPVYVRNAVLRVVPSDASRDWLVRAR
jgi:mannosyltransferase